MERDIHMNSLQSFVHGLKRFLRYPQVLFSAYIINLLSVALLIFVPALLLAEPAHYTAIKTAADGIDTWLVTELLMSTSTYPALQGLSESLPPAWLQTSMIMILGVLLAAPFFSWIPSSFLAGGALITYVESPQRFSWRRFFWGGWHWFGAFLLVNLLLGIVTQILLVILLMAMQFVSSAAGGWVNYITVPLFILVMIVWLVILEYTRLFAVSKNTRNIFKAFAEAVRLLFTRPVALLGLYVLSILILFLMHAIFRPLLVSDIAGVAVLYLIFSQVFILMRLSARLARWAAAVDIQAPAHIEVKASEDSA